MRRLTFALLVLAVFIVLRSQAAFADPCPAVGDNAAGACNIVITIAANGSISTAAGSATQPYDNVLKGIGNGEDVTVGVINNSAQTITSLIITGTPTGGDLGPFSFDEASAADGVCDPSLGSVAGSVALPCSAGQTVGNAFPFGPTGYESSADISFSNFASLTTGTVNFKNGILGAGKSTWFGLEAPAGLNLTVQPTPEPGSILLLATGLGLMGLFVTRRFRTV